MFSIGERVKVNGHLGTVAHRQINAQDNWEYKIAFDNPSLIGGTGWFPEESLVSVELRRKPSTQNNCPICGSPWVKTQSPIYGEEWQDCPKCNKTKEQILG